jgi:hypothetical protein
VNAKADSGAGIKGDPTHAGSGHRGPKRFREIGFPLEFGYFPQEAVAEFLGWLDAETDFVDWDSRVKLAVRDKLLECLRRDGR